MLVLLIGAALRSLFLAAAVATGLRLRRTHNPHVSLAAWTIVLAASLSMPVAMRLTSIAPPHGIIPVGVIPVGIIPVGIIPVGIIPVGIIPVGIIPVGQLPLVLESLVQTEASFVTSRAEPSAPAALPAQMPWRELAWSLYLAVFGALMLRLLVGLSLSWRIARAATPVREDWAGNLDVRASQRVNAPATFCSAILLPSDHVAWTPAMRWAVLAHEGAHVARRDFAIQLAAAINRTVFWFNPFSWWLQRHLSDLAEAASDDAAIARLNDRVGYAEILLEISGRVSRLPSTVSMARHAAVASRIERILSETPLPASMSRRGRSMLAAGIVPLAVLLSFLIVLPAPPPQLSPSAEAPAEVEILADEGPADGMKQPTPSPAPAIAAAVMAPPLAASLPPPPSTPPLSRSPAAAREAPRLASHPMTKNTLGAQTSRSTRQPNRTANNQGVLDRSPGPEVVNSVGSPSVGAASEDGQSPLFKRIVNETCTGTYLGVVEGVYPARIGFYPVQAHFYRGPGDAPWVTFYFAAERPANLPVTIRGSEIKFTSTFGGSEVRFTSTYGAIYTLLPSRNMASPARYHRITGSAEHSPGGTIDFACRELNQSL